MGVDIAHRFGISEAHVSCIWASWLEFLYHELGALPIWASHDYYGAYIFRTREGAKHMRIARKLLSFSL